MLEVRLNARCFPTEDRDKVVKAMVGLFPDAVFSGTDPITGVSSSVEAFGELLTRYRIRDAARAIMRRGMKDNSTCFRLNKQVASVGRISFSEESHALGDIEVTIISDDIVAVIDSIAPATRKDEKK